MPRKQSAPPVSYPKASPDKRLVIQADPASSEVKRGQEGGCHHSPPKDRNPAPNFIGPWMIVPLAVLAWAPAAYVLWEMLHG